MTTPEQIAGLSETMGFSNTSILQQERADGYRDGFQHAREVAAQRAMTAYDEAYYKGRDDGCEHCRLKKGWLYVLFGLGFICGGLLW